MSYHHGMPFCANSTAVSSRSKGGRPMTRLLKELAFSVLMTRSCGPSAAGSLDALSFARNSPFPTRSVRPWAFTASRCGPRITQDTSCPASASRTAKWLPIAPARAGCRTLLIERYGFLGGMGTAAGVTNFCGLHANVHGEMHRVVQGVASDLLARIDRLGGLSAPHLILGKILAQAYDTAAYKIAADDLLAAHKVDILFHALGAGAVMHDERRINALVVETKAGRQAVTATIFIDCSGDGDLAAWAGAPFEVGDNKGGMLYPSMMFRLNGIDPEKAGEAWRTIPGLMEKAEAEGSHKFPRKGAIVRPQRSQIEWRSRFPATSRAGRHPAQTPS